MPKDRTRTDSEESRRDYTNLWRVTEQQGLLSQNESDMINYNEDDEEEDGEEHIEIGKMSKEEIIFNCREHLYNVAISRRMREDSKELAKEHKKTLTYCCFDLQQVLECPFTKVGDVFYKRTLSCYNFVVNDNYTGYCYFWSQDEGNRGVNEIATNLISFAIQKQMKVLTEYCGLL